MEEHWKINCQSLIILAKVELASPLQRTKDKLSTTASGEQHFLTNCLITRLPKFKKTPAEKSNNNLIMSFCGMHLVFILAYVYNCRLAASKIPLEQHPSNGEGVFTNKALTSDFKCHEPSIVTSKTLLLQSLLSLTNLS